MYNSLDTTEQGDGQSDRTDTTYMAACCQMRETYGLAVAGGTSGRLRVMSESAAAAALQSLLLAPLDVVAVASLDESLHGSNCCTSLSLPLYAAAALRPTNTNTPYSQHSRTHCTLYDIFHTVRTAAAQPP